MGAAQASTYLQNRLIDHLFRSATFAKPSALYIALFTAPPSDAGGGTEVPGGVGYARVNLPPLDTNWRATQGGTTGISSGSGGTSNALTVTFGAPTVNWGTVTHWAIYDAVTAGNLLIWDALTVSRPIIGGDPPPAFNIDSISVVIS
jgi:hypothetical protein